MKKFLLALLTVYAFAAPPLAAQPTFAPATDFTVGTDPRGIVVGGFNGDGFPDFAVCNFDDDNVSVLLGRGNGTFRTAGTFSAGDQPADIAIGDFNGDGQQDLVVANVSSNSISVLLGNSDGTFGSAINTSTVTVPIRVATGDFNSDGQQDVVVSRPTGAGDIAVLLGNNDGTFSALIPITVGASPFGLAVADFDFDGNFDIVVSNNGTNSVTALRGNGNATFSPTNYTVGTSPSDIALADINSDGRPDIVVTVNSTGNISVLFNDGLGGFNAPINTNLGFATRDIAISDFNNDGQRDVAVTSVFNLVSVFLGDGTGAFPTVTNLAITGNQGDVAIGDFNRDDRQDIVASNASGNTVSVLLNTTGLQSSVTVTNGNDDGAGSLRQALRDVALTGGTIVFDASVSTITLLGGELAITKDVSINGTFNNPSGVTVRRDAAAFDFRIFHAFSSASLIGLTIENGRATVALPNNQLGGGILIEGSTSMTVDRCVVQNNQANGGGAAGGGGGITVGNFEPAALTISNSLIRNNTTSGNNGGAGISVFFNGTLIAINTVISGNTAGFGSGGVFGEVGSDIRFRNSTVTGNTNTFATGSGGGIVWVGSNFSLRNTAVIFNSASTNPNIDGTPTLIATSITSNPATYPFHSRVNSRLIPTATTFIGQGTTGSPTPITDFDGSLRPNPPSIGAFEAVAAVPTAGGSFNAPFANFNSTNPFGTGVSFAVSGATVGDEFTVQRFNTGSSGAPPAGIDRLSPYYWVLAANSAFASADITFDWSGIPNNGVTDPASVRLLQRDGFGAPWRVIATGGSGSTISVSGLTSFSEFALGGTGGDNPLPVALSAFTGNAAPSGVSLQWTTASETNHAGFVVLRSSRSSAEPATPSVEIASYRFESTLRGKGTTTSATNYSFSDGAVETGKTYTYTLRSVDNDGTIHNYARTVSVEVREPIQTPAITYALEQNYPNPFNPATVIRYSVREAGNVSLKVFDMVGREVQTLVNQAQPSGQYQVSFNAGSLASGIYIYRIQIGSSSSQAGNFTRTLKMLLVK